MKTGPTRILVVDDSALYRQLIHNVLRDNEDVSIVGLAKDGAEALEMIQQLDPDLLTLDLQMPDMDGIEVLQEIKRRRLPAKAIMVSSYTSEGAQLTTDALMEGAFDFILKPSSSDSASNRQQLRDALGEKIAAFRESSRRRSATTRKSLDKSLVEPEDTGEGLPVDQAACQAVIIGLSTGGPEALRNTLPRLPSGLPVPVLVVQHMPANYTRSLAARLNQLCELQVVEAADNLEAIAGKIFIAAGGRQLKLQRRDDRLLLRVTDDPPENGVRPAVDYLLRSAAEVIEGRTLAVIMTGMGRDGLAGCTCIKQAGGYVFAQHQDDCVVYGMPKTVIEEGLVDRVVPLGRIPAAIVRHVQSSRRS